MSSMFLIVALAGVGLFFSLAYLSERETPLRWILVLLLALVNAGALAIGVPFAVLGMSASTRDMLSQSISDLDMALSAEAVAGFGANLPWLGVISLAVGMCGMALLVPAVRRVVARILPIDPVRNTHMLALQLATHVVGISAAVALFLPVLLLDESVLESTAGSVADAGLGALWAQSIGFVVLSALGVGFVVERDLSATLSRLGLTRRVHWKWWMVGTIAALASSVAVDFLWSMFDSQSLAEVERLSKALFAPYLRYGLLGALTIGLSAGIGEEILFRGAAQPRLGLVFTSLLFTAVHTQYTVSLALLQILVVGLLLGLTRRHANTTTAIATHATYNLTLALLALYLPELAP